MKHLMEKLEQLLELGGIKKDVTFLVISGIAVICSLLKWNPLPFDMAWVAIVLCGTLRRESADTIAAVTGLGVQPVLLSPVTTKTPPGPSRASCRSARCGQAAYRRISSGISPWTRRTSRWWTTRSRSCRTLWRSRSG